MTKFPEGLPAGWQPYDTDSAYFLGRLTAADIALPNEPHLRQNSLFVCDPSTPSMRAQMRRLVTATARIVTMPGTSLAGFSHAQLQTNKSAPRPLRMFLAETEFPELGPPINVAGKGMQLFINTRPHFPQDPDAPMTTFKEGCFSSGLASVLSRRYAELPRVEVDRPNGPKVTLKQVTEFGSIVVQHEFGHDVGKRAADQRVPGSPIHWVTRPRVGEHQATVPLDNYGIWTPNCPQEQWEALSGLTCAPGEYPFLHTPDLIEAYKDGFADEERRWNQHPWQPDTSLATIL